MMTRRWSVAPVVVTLALLGGCVQPAGQPGGGMSDNPGTSSAGGPGSAAPSRYPSGFPVSPSPGTGKPAPAGPETTLTGTVLEGVEGGCLLLQHGGTVYLLLGGDRSIVKAGAAVTVRGRATPGVVTTCMQGVPFQVTSASPR
jgi:hypothetical protein